MTVQYLFQQVLCTTELDESTK